MTHIPHTAFGALVLLDTLRIRGRTDVPMVIEPEIGAIDSGSHVDAVCAIANSGGGVAYIGTAKHSRYVLRLGTPDHGLVRRVERDLRARVSPLADTRVFAEQGTIIIVVRPSSAPCGPFFDRQALPTPRLLAVRALSAVDSDALRSEPRSLNAGLATLEAAPTIFDAARFTARGAPSPGRFDHAGEMLTLGELHATGTAHARREYPGLCVTIERYGVTRDLGRTHGVRAVESVTWSAPPFRVDQRLAEVAKRLRWAPDVASAVRAAYRAASTHLVLSPRRDGPAGIRVSIFDDGVEIANDGPPPSAFVEIRSGDFEGKFARNPQTAALLRQLWASDLDVRAGRRREVRCDDGATVASIPIGPGARPASTVQPESRAADDRDRPVLRPSDAAVLDAMTSEPLGARDIARRAGLGASTARASLRRLVSSGLVERTCPGARSPAQKYRRAGSRIRTPASERSVVPQQLPVGTQSQSQS